MSYNTITSNNLKYYEKDHNYAIVLIVPMFQDNYGYIIIDKASGLSATVDPGESEPIIQVLQDRNILLNQIWCTHKHNDHIGGNAALKSYFKNVEILGTKYEPIPLVDKPLSDESQFELGNCLVTVWHVPCHTKGHISFIVQSKETNEPKILFSGDTLFVGGCGRFFEGKPLDMLNNMNRFSTLPNSTYVYCAHEYTLANYKFLVSVDKKTCMNKYNEILNIRNVNGITVPSTIESEKDTNLFMRCHDINVQKILKASNPEEAMKMLRDRKNNFQ